MKTAIAVRHVHFEDLGTLEPLLHRRGYTFHYYDVGVQKLDAPEVDKADLLVVLGAPIGAFDEKTYPFLTQELRLIEQRLNHRSPLLGVCLGAQLMARVLGASVATSLRFRMAWRAWQAHLFAHISLLAFLQRGSDCPNHGNRPRIHKLFRGIIVQALTEPSLDFCHAHILALVIVNDLIPVDLANAEIPRFRMREVESADA
jgi:GMP synthase-like glutamine amidotransferase